MTAHLRAVKTYQRRHRAQGLCTKCRRPVQQGRWLCLLHREAARARRRAKVVQGLCVNCWVPAEPGRTLCARHLANLRAYKRRGRRRIASTRAREPRSGWGMASSLSRG